MRFFVPALLLVVLPTIGIAQDVEYERFALDNGMTVILHEDHRLPIATINTWFYVGAKDEPIGRSGFAHLFEHLMFMGTERVPGGEFDTTMEGKGGANNASTDFDRTNYYSWGPAEILPTLLWLDADRLEGLGRAMTQEKLDLQREVVRNERRQTSENMPYGKSQLVMVDLLYPVDHPYHDDVIGSHADLEAATVADVKEFFANFYVPNNASLVIAGDFDSETIKPLVRDLFGDIPRGPEPTRRRASPPQLSGETRKTLFDQVRLPMLRFGWISPSAYQPGDAEMTLAADILAREPSGRLYRRLVIEEELAVDVSAHQEPLILGSNFTLSILVSDPANLDRVERIVDEEIAALATWGPTASELERSVVELEVLGLDLLQDLSAVAEGLNEYQFQYGEPNSFRTDLARFAAITPRSLARQCAETLGRDRVVIRVLSNDAELPTSARDQAPDDLPPRSFQVEAPQTFQTAAGIPVYLWSRPELPLVEVAVFMSDDLDVPLDPAGMEGRASLLVDLMSEAGGDLDADEFAVALEALGAGIGAESDYHSVTLRLSALSRNLEPSLGLFADALLRPRLDQDDFDRVKRLRLEEIKRRADSPRATATEVGRRLLFGDGHPGAIGPGGDVTSIEGLTLSDLRDALPALIDKARASIFIAGDVTKDDVRRYVDPLLSSWKAASLDSGRTRRDWTTPTVDGLRVAIVDRPGAVQTYVDFFMPGIDRADPKRVAYDMIDTLLGGSFTSRLNQNLREDKGYTYGAGSSFSLAPRAGVFTAASSVRADVTGAAVAEFLREFDRIRAGDITDGEVDKARATLRTSTIEEVADLASLLDLAMEQTLAGLPATSVNDDLSAMNPITARELNAIARAAIPLESAVLVLVGDATSVRTQLEPLDLPDPILVDGGP